MNRNYLVLLALVLLLCSIPIGASAQDSLNVQCLNQYHHNWDNCVVGVRIDGDYAYLACENDGIRILNISNPDHIIEVSRYSSEGAYSIAKSGNFIYLGVYSGVSIIDVSDPLHPSYIQTISVEGYTNAIRVFGNYAYVCKMYTTTGLTIIDISNPYDAHIVSQSYDIDQAYDVDVRNDTAFVAAGFQGMWLFDISDINYPRYLNSFTNENGEGVIGVVISGNYAYLGCVVDGLRVIDLSTLQVVNSNDTLFYCLWIEKANDKLYVEYGVDYYQLATVDISDPINPVIASTYYPPYGIKNFCISGNRAYIADYDRGLRVLDISNPAFMSEVYTYNHYGIDLGVVVSGDYAYVQNDLSLAIVNVSDIQNPREIGRFEVIDHCFDLKIKDNIAYILKSSNVALCAVDISNPESPTKLGEFVSPAEEQFSFGIYDHYAYIAEPDSMRILDISDPHSIFQVGISYCNHSRFVLAVYDHFMVCCQADRSISVVDLSDPLHPQLVRSFVLDEYSYSAKVVGNKIYIVAPNYLWIYDISNWTLFSETFLQDLFWCDARSIEINGNYAYLSGELAGLTVLDISDPTAPQLAGYYKNSGGSYGIALAGNTVVLASFNNLGFYEFTPAVGIDDPSQPAIPKEFALLPNYPNPFNNATSISYDLPTQAKVMVDIYDIAGRKIRELLSETQSAGHHAVTYDAAKASSGIYFYRIQAGGFSQSRKMILLK